jgi:hypothetical protein
VKETSGTIGAIKIAHKEFDIEVSDNFHTALTQRGILIFEPLPALSNPLHREVSGIALVGRSV